MPRMLLVFALLALALGPGCSYEHFIRYPLSDEQEDAAAPRAAHELDCPEEEVQASYRTLLTRTMVGCDKQVVYAYDWMLDRWWSDFDTTPEGDDPPPAEPRADAELSEE